MSAESIVNTTFFGLSFYLDAEILDMHFVAFDVIIQEFYSKRPETLSYKRTKNKVS